MAGLGFRAVFVFEFGLGWGLGWRWSLLSFQLGLGHNSSDGQGREVELAMVIGADAETGADRTCSLASSRDRLDKLATAGGDEG